MNSHKHIPVFLALGSNIEPRDSFLQKAITKLKELPVVHSLKESRIIETRPVGPSTKMYLNMAVELEVFSKSPMDFLTKILAIESSLGRTRDIRWGDRTIDIDIIFWGDQIIAQQHLTVPHPRLSERMFVLEPLMDLNPEFVNPKTNKTIRELHLILKDKIDEN